MIDLLLTLLQWALVSAGCAVGFGVVARSMAVEADEQERDERGIK